MKRKLLGMFSLMNQEFNESHGSNRDSGPTTLPCWSTSSYMFAPSSCVVRTVLQIKCQFAGEIICRRGQCTRPVQQQSCRGCPAYVNFNMKLASICISQGFLPFRLQTKLSTRNLRTFPPVSSSLVVWVIMMHCQSVLG